MTEQQIKERDDILSSNIIKWCIAYYDMFTCYTVYSCYQKVYDNKALSSAYNAECNTMLRRASKFREFLTEECYNSVCSSIKELCDEYYINVKKSLKEDGLL